jgi:hypothetical protein
MKTDIARPPNETGGIVTPAHSDFLNAAKLREQPPEINTSVLRTWVNGASWWLARYERTQNRKNLTAFHLHVDGIWLRTAYARPQ